jgi:hypothetical protein
MRSNVLLGMDTPFSDTKSVTDDAVKDFVDVAMLDNDITAPSQVIGWKMFIDPKVSSRRKRGEKENRSGKSIRADMEIGSRTCAGSYERIAV